MERDGRTVIGSHKKLFPEVPEARVSFDRLDRCWPLVVEVEGWLLSPHAPFDRIEGYLNGRLIGNAESVIREDVRDTFPWIPHAVDSGFRIKIDPYRVIPDAMNHLDFIGLSDGRRTGHTHTLFRPELENLVPTPPGRLMVRVAGHQDAATFKLGGLKCFGDFYDAIRRHRDPSDVRRLLDWGCGCGRIAVHFLTADFPNELFGCDVDPEAVAWCRENLTPAEFAHTGTRPPLAYADKTFDVILGYSVFTHLKRDAQAAWLGELKRVLAPGGLIIASVHGAYAAAFEWPPDQAADLLRDGIFDQNPDESLRDVVEPGYYQNTFQTREYTIQEWSKQLEIVEYIEAGMNSYQDMVIMR